MKTNNFQKSSLILENRIKANNFSIGLKSIGFQQEIKKKNYLSLGSYEELKKNFVNIFISLEVNR